jgi:hypothetical protein
VSLELNLFTFIVPVLADGVANGKNNGMDDENNRNVHENVFSGLMLFDMVKDVTE